MGRISLRLVAQNRSYQLHVNWARVALPVLFALAPICEARLNVKQFWRNRLICSRRMVLAGVPRLRIEPDADLAQSPVRRHKPSSGYRFDHVSKNCLTLGHASPLYRVRGSICRVLDNQFLFVPTAGAAGSAGVVSLRRLNLQVSADWASAPAGECPGFLVEA